VRRLLIPAIVILAAAGVAALLVLRGGDEADLEFTGGFGTRALDRAVRDVGASQYAGRGRVAALFTVESTRDEPLRLSVPATDRRQLRSQGIGASVGFLPTRGVAVIPGRIIVSRLRPELPPGTRGAIVHVFDLRRCRPGSRVDVTSFGLDVAAPGGDRHPALVPVAIASDKYALARYDDDPPGELRLRCVT
jgi:hypothetical protein